MDNERRELLTWLGIGGSVGSSTVVGATLRGSDGKPNSDQAELLRTQDGRHADEFVTAVDVVAAGADPDGNEPRNGVLKRHADETLRSFPDGTDGLRPTDFSGDTLLDIAAAGETPPSFRAFDHCFAGGDAFVRFDDVAALLLDGVEFDVTSRGEQ